MANLRRLSKEQFVTRLAEVRAAKALMAELQATTQDGWAYVGSADGLFAAAERLEAWETVKARRQA